MPHDMSKRRCKDIASFVYFKSLLSRSRKIFPAPFRFTILCLLILVIWSVFYLFPATDYASDSLYPKCPFYALTGWHCAGCGSLRTISCLARGDISTAWKKNKFTVICIPFLLWSFIGYGAKCFKIRFPQIFIKPIWIWVLLGLIILFGILRNIQIYPLYLLAPH